MNNIYRCPICGCERFVGKACVWCKDGFDDICKSCTKVGNDICMQWNNLVEDLEKENEKLRSELEFLKNQCAFKVNGECNFNAEAYIDKHSTWRIRPIDENHEYYWCNYLHPEIDCIREINNFDECKYCGKLANIDNHKKCCDECKDYFESIRYK